MNIALIAHDDKKELMTEFCNAYCGILSQHSIFATGVTGKRIEDEIGLKINKLLPGSQGGSDQLSAKISYNEIDLLLFFRSANPKAYEPSSNDLIRLCDAHNIPVATNIATAESLVRGLERGDLSWREAVRK